jgi:hypothetical protein
MFPSWFMGISSLKTNDGAMILYQRTTSPLYPIAKTAANVIDWNKWNHLVYTFQRNASSTSITMYKNGVSQSLVTNDFTSVVLDNTSLTPGVGRGGHSGSVGDNIAGGFYDLSTFAGYNKVLSAADVQTLYNNTKARYNNTLTSLKVIFAGSPVITDSLVEYTMNQVFIQTGYQSPPTLNITDLWLTSSYDGSDLDVNAYDAVFITTNTNGSGSSALATNLKNYMLAGGGVVFNPGVGSSDLLNPGGSNFDAALLPFNTKTAGEVVDLNPQTITVESNSHPINIATGTGSYFVGSFSPWVGYDTGSLRPGATLIASMYYSTTRPYASAHEYAGVSRCAHLNYYLIGYNVLSSPMLHKKILANSLRWASRVI